MQIRSNKYLFILSPPFSGSTVLWQLLATSPNVSRLPVEGQHLTSVKDILRRAPWDENYEIPWSAVKDKWEQEWDLGKPILLEKSPPHLIRAAEIESAFEPAYFIIMMRDPYAFCEGYVRRRGDSMAEAAAFWVKCARRQMHNMKALKRYVFVTYEHLCDHPEAAVNELTEFLPQLAPLMPGNSFSARSIIGYEARPISNMNKLKTKLLSNTDLIAINQVLESEMDCVNFFGYQLLATAAARDIDNITHRIYLQAVRSKARLRRIARRLKPGQQLEIAEESLETQTGHLDN